MKSLRLSVEEMAYLIGMAGGSQQAGAFLRLVTGDLDPGELQGRLLAAAHSLLARGWLRLDERQQKHVASELQGYLDHLLNSDYSLRFSKIVQGQEQIVTIFVRGSSFLGEYLEHGVVICLEWIPDQEEVVERACAFLEFASAISHDVVGGREIRDIRADVLQKSRELAEQGKTYEAFELLVRAGLDQVLAEELIAEMAQALWRATALKLRPIAERVVSESGFLLLRGAHHTWIFEVLSQEPPMIRILPGDRKTFRSLVSKMMQP